MGGTAGGAGRRGGGWPPSRQFGRVQAARAPLIREAETHRAREERAHLENHRTNQHRTRGPDHSQDWLRSHSAHTSRKVHLGAIQAVQRARACGNLAAERERREIHQPRHPILPLSWHEMLWVLWSAAASVDQGAGRTMHVSCRHVSRVRLHALRSRLTNGASC